jgi:Pyruvate/2-oxoacid:ferredoxin oxidoreductase delta subunit
MTASAIGVVLYEGPGSQPLADDRRIGLFTTLLEKGYSVSRVIDPIVSASADTRHLLVLGRFSGAPGAQVTADDRLHLQDVDSVDDGAVLARLESLARDADAPVPGGWKPWFPVIDYQRCTNCMQCLSFCLFDVYGVKDGRIQVQHQDHCKTDCPACSRVCPEVAIMFPKYRHGPINGDEVQADDVRREAMKVDISALLGGDVYALLRDRSAKAKSRFSKERDEDRALTERNNCLIKLKQQMDIEIPPEVLASLPSPDEIRKKAEAAAAKAEAALRDRIVPSEG